MNNDVMLSIVVMTFNHEKYISMALDSILSQQTNFLYEIIVGDDASTDSTPQILEEYSCKYGDKLTLILRKKIWGEKGQIIYMICYLDARENIL